MKFVCELASKTYLFENENLDDPREAARMTCREYDKEVGLEYDTEYKVSVYDETGLTAFPLKKIERYKYNCSIEQYSMDFEVRADNPYTACVKALLTLSRDFVFDGRESIKIDAESEEGINGTYHFFVHGPDLSKDGSICKDQ